MIATGTLRKKRSDHRSMHAHLVLRVIDIFSSHPSHCVKRQSSRIDQPQLTSNCDERETVRWWLNIEHPVGRLHFNTEMVFPISPMLATIHIACSGPPAWITAARGLAHVELSIHHSDAYTFYISCNSCPVLYISTSICALQPHMCMSQFLKTSVYLDIQNRVLLITTPFL